MDKKANMRVPFIHRNCSIRRFSFSFVVPFTLAYCIIHCPIYNFILHANQLQIQQCCHGGGNWKPSMLVLAKQRCTPSTQNLGAKSFGWLFLHHRPATVLHVMCRLSCVTTVTNRRHCQHSPQWHCCWRRRETNRRRTFFCSLCCNQIYSAAW